MDYVIILIIKVLTAFAPEHNCVKQNCARATQEQSEQRGS